MSSAGPQAFQDTNTTLKKCVRARNAISCTISERAHSFYSGVYATVSSVWFSNTQASAGDQIHRAHLVESNWGGLAFTFAINTLGEDDIHGPEMSLKNTALGQEKKKKRWVGSLFQSTCLLNWLSDQPRKIMINNKLTTIHNFLKKVNRHRTTYILAAIIIIIIIIIIFLGKSESLQWCSP